MATGTVKFWNETRGFGFITGPDGADVFVHISAFRQTGFADEPVQGQQVEYEIGVDPRTGRTLQCDGVFVRADLAKRAESV